MTAIEDRKQRHIRVSLEEQVEADVGTGLREVTLIHRCIPEINLGDVDSGVTLFGRRLKAPLIISAITGGTREAERINAVLARVAEKTGIGIGVGSQRIAVQQPETERSFSVVREEAPSTLVLGNLGVPQLAKGWGLREAERCIEMVDADALCLHMNPLQEAVQVDGDTDFAGILQRVRELAAGVSKPLVMKETGAGIAYEDALKLEKAGVAGFEISGVGGTSWSAVEHHIAREVEKPEMEHLGKALWNWGIPTAASVVEVRKASRGTIIASGGLRSGTDVAKCIALGADLGGIAKPFLEAAVRGEEELTRSVESIIREMRAVMFLTGSRNLAELREKPLVVVGRTAEWLRARGVDPSDYARR